ncbi:MAG: right-handed parallel beta-helix repeat-containing protein [Chloroflexi bacterium]|nr:right-handed parallel beta-helix repeat-containing protein [Chloroflexota bacterium]
MRYFLVTLILLLCFAPALATDYTVDEDCTLSDALRAANADLERGECPAGDGADTITLTADITLTGELPRIISDITIDGAGFTISGDGEWRVFYVDMGGALTLQNIHLTEARAHSEVSFISVWGSTDYSKSGGAILVNRGSRLELVNSRFTDNAAADFGGVLDTWDSEVIVTDSVFSDNKAEDGGAIASAFSVVTISNSSFEGNRVRDDGGALQVFNSTAYVTDSQFTGNSAARRGGAITVFRGTVEQSGNTFSDNVGGDCAGC